MSVYSYPFYVHPHLVHMSRDSKQQYCFKINSNPTSNHQVAKGPTSIISHTPPITTPNYNPNLIIILTFSPSNAIPITGMQPALCTGERQTSKQCIRGLVALQPGFKTHIQVSTKCNIVVFKQNMNMIINCPCFRTYFSQKIFWYDQERTAYTL